MATVSKDFNTPIQVAVGGKKIKLFKIASCTEINI